MVGEYKQNKGISFFKIFFRASVNKIEYDVCQYGKSLHLPFCYFT